MPNSSWDTGRFMKNVCVDTIYNITQKSQELLKRYNCACGLIGKSPNLVSSLYSTNLVSSPYQSRTEGGRYLLIYL